MKVYVVTAFTAEPYENDSWVDSVWSSREKARQYILDNPGPIGQDLENYDYGYFLSQNIDEMEVQ